MIRVTDIHKSFGTLEVLKGVSLDVAQGEVVSIVGASGAGKTTLLQIIGTLSRPDGGRVEIDGRDVSALGDRALSQFRNERIGFVFQFYNLVPNLTALENVELASQICPDSLNAAETLCRVGLGKRLNNFPAQLSGGEQQRVAIARALAKNPKLLLCDEPTGALDYRTGKQILQLLQDTCRSSHITALVITHNAALAPMADRVIRMNSGRVTSIETNAHPTPIAEIEW